MSLFGSLPQSEIVPVSCPFVLFRNKDAYRFKTTYSKKTPRIPFISKALNQTYYYITPYTSIHASIPSSSTELSFNLSYDFTIDSKQDK